MYIIIIIIVVAVVFVVVVIEHCSDRSRLKSHGERISQYPHSEGQNLVVFKTTKTFAIAF